MGHEGWYAHAMLRCTHIVNMNQAPVGDQCSPKFDIYCGSVVDLPPAGLPRAVNAEPCSRLQIEEAQARGAAISDLQQQYKHVQWGVMTGMETACRDEIVAAEVAGRSVLALQVPFGASEYLATGRIPLKSAA